MTLFIGGSHDGERIATKCGENVKLPPKSTVSIGGIHDRSETFEPEIYRLTRLRGNSKTFDVFLLSGLSEDDLMSRLIDGYQTDQP